jgi:hypothetical protein
MVISKARKTLRIPCHLLGLELAFMLSSGMNSSGIDELAGSKASGPVLMNGQARVKSP